MSRLVAAHSIQGGLNMELHFLILLWLVGLGTGIGLGILVLRRVLKLDLVGFALVGFWLILNVFTIGPNQLVLLYNIASPMAMGYFGTILVFRAGDLFCLPWGGKNGSDISRDE